MTSNAKQAWLDAAEVFDSWRVVPRLIVGSYVGFVGWLTWYVVTMYFHIPASDRTGQLTAFVTILLPTAYGAFPFIYKIYSDAGRDWDVRNRPPVVVAAQATATSS